MKGYRYKKREHKKDYLKMDDKGVLGVTNLDRKN